MPKVEESAFSANQFLFKLIVPKAHTLIRQRSVAG